MMLLVLPLASAEIFVSGRNTIDVDDKTWTQHSFANYPESETAFLSLPVVRAVVVLGCEGLTNFNSKNPSNIILNSTLKYQVLQFSRDAGGVFNTTIIEDYIGCGGGKGTCDNTNTPVFFVTQEFFLSEGQWLSVDLTTLFNETSGIEEDTICRYSVSYDSINCDSCGEASFEEVISRIDEREETFQTVSTIYSFMNAFVNLNYKLWVYLSWIVKIVALVGTVFFFFYSLYWLYFASKRLFNGVKN